MNSNMSIEMVELSKTGWDFRQDWSELLPYLFLWSQIIADHTLGYGKHIDTMRL